MNQSITTPGDYKAAVYSVERIKPVLEVLQNLNPQALRHNAEAVAKLTEFTQFLTDIYEQNKAIIAKGDEQFDCRPIELISAAASRLLNEIPHLIELEQKSLQARKECRELKANELVKKGFSDAEICRIIPPIAQNEIDASAAIIAGFKAEAEDIKKFLSDSPRYSTELLKQTSIYPVTKAEEAA